MNTVKFSNNDIDKFILFLRKGVYSDDYMSSWERFNEAALPEKAKVYNNLNMEDTTDVDYVHVKRIYKDFEIKNLGEYHDLYLRSNVLLLADFFENFRRMCLEIYEWDPAKLISAPSTLKKRESLKNTQVKLDLITVFDMLLMIEKNIRGSICNAVHAMQKLIINMCQITMKINNLHILLIGM